MLEERPAPSVQRQREAYRQAFNVRRHTQDVTPTDAARRTTHDESYRDFSARIHTDASRERRITNAQIELTYGCNLHCVHCYTDCYNQPHLIKRELAVEEWERILDELRDVGVLWLAMTGGEVFVRKDFRTLYLAAKARGFIVTLLSNATTITEDLANFLAEHPPFKLEISCHGATPETFDAVTQVPGSFVKFCEGMHRLQARGIGYRIKTKAMTINRQELAQIETFVESLGAEFQVNGTIYPRLNGDLVPTTYRLTPEAIVAIEQGQLDEDRCCDERPPLPDVRRASNVQRQRESVSSNVRRQTLDATPADAAGRLTPPRSDRLYRCGCGGWSVHINAWGLLSACTWFKEPRISVRDHSVAEAVELCFTQIHNARYTSDSPCRTCRVHTFCDKMPAAAWAETPDGDVEQPVPDLCHTAYARAKAYTGWTAPAPV